MAATWQLVDLCGEEYLAARSADGDPLVVTAYKLLELETDQMFRRLTEEAHPKATRIVFTRCGGPYCNDSEMIRAVQSSGTLEVTCASVRSGRLHPLLGCEVGGPFDRFRAVHDLLGHVAQGAGFDIWGEHVAWHAQSRLYSGLARWAFATEIWGVNAARQLRGEPPELKAALLSPRLIDGQRCSENRESEMSRVAVSCRPFHFCRTRMGTGSS